MSKKYEEIELKELPKKLTEEHARAMDSGLKDGEAVAPEEPFELKSTMELRSLYDRLLNSFIDGIIYENAPSLEAALKIEISKIKNTKEFWNYLKKEIKNNAEFEKAAGQYSLAVEGAGQIFSPGAVEKLTYLYVLSKTPNNLYFKAQGKAKKLGGLAAEKAGGLLRIKNEKAREAAQTGVNMVRALYQNLPLAYLAPNSFLSVLKKSVTGAMQTSANVNLNDPLWTSVINNYNSGISSYLKNSENYLSTYLYNYLNSPEEDPELKKATKEALIRAVPPSRRERIEILIGMVEQDWKNLTMEVSQKIENIDLFASRLGNRKLENSDSLYLYAFASKLASKRKELQTKALSPEEKLKLSEKIKNYESVIVKIKNSEKLSPKELNFLKEGLKSARNPIFWKKDPRIGAFLEEFERNKKRIFVLNVFARSKVASLFTGITKALATPIVFVKKIVINGIVGMSLKIKGLFSKNVLGGKEKTETPVEKIAPPKNSRIHPGLEKRAKSIGSGIDKNSGSVDYKKPNIKKKRTKSLEKIF